MENYFLLREKILKQFDEIKNFKFMFISAPYGYGKTLEVKNWSKTVSYNIKWLNLSMEDNDKDMFISHISNLLEL